MQVVFIDRFVVPNAAKAEFLERMKINRDFIKTLPGFIEDSAYEEAGGAESHYVTTALWRDDQAAIKAVYLAIVNIQKKWTMAIHNWGTILNQFNIIFDDRCNL